MLAYNIMLEKKLAYAGIRVIKGSERYTFNNELNTRRLNLSLKTADARRTTFTQFLQKM